MFSCFYVTSVVLQHVKKAELPQWGVKRARPLLATAQFRNNWKCVFLRVFLLHDFVMLIGFSCGASLQANTFTGNIRLKFHPVLEQILLLPG